MSSSSLATLLAALALGGVCLLYVKISDLEDHLRPARSVGDRAAPAATDLADDHAGRDAATAARVPVRAAQANPAEVNESEEGDADQDPAALLARIRKLEAAQRRSALRPGRMPGSVWGSRKRPVMSVGGLAKRLQLTTNQRDRVDEIVKRGKQRVEEILAIPDADGVSPQKRRADTRKKMQEAMQAGKHGEIVGLAMNARSHRKKKIPGSNETYGEAIDRVQKETRDEIGQTLSPEQQSEFKETNVDPLLGGGGSATTQIAFVSDEGPGGDSEMAGTHVIGGVMIEEGSGHEGDGGFVDAEIDVIDTSAESESGKDG